MIRITFDALSNYGQFGFYFISTDNNPYIINNQIITSINQSL